MLRSGPDAIETKVTILPHAHQLSLGAIAEVAKLVGFKLFVGAWRAGEEAKRDLGVG